MKAGPSPALEMLCDHLHDFLVQLDASAWLGPAAPGARVALAACTGTASGTAEPAALRRGGGRGGAPPGPPPSALRAFPTAAGAAPALVGHGPLLRWAVQQLQRGLVGRSVEARLLVLALVAGEHLLLLGPPGTAKSALSRRLAEVVRGDYFERLLTRFTTPEELFGPLSLRALEQDVYRRVVQGYLPTAEVTFLDEIFKVRRRRTGAWEAVVA